MSDEEGVVTVCPLVFVAERDRGTMIAVRLSYWRDDDSYAGGPSGHAQLFLPAELAVDLGRRLLEEAEKTGKGTSTP